MTKHLLLALVALPAAAQSYADPRVHLLAQISVSQAGPRCDAIANLRWLDEADGTRVIADCDDGDSHVLKLAPDEKSRIRSFKYRFEYVGRCGEITDEQRC